MRTKTRPDYATAKEALESIVTLFCCGCSLAVGMQPDEAMQDPQTERWVPLVDEAPECECRNPDWRYLR